MLWVNLALRNSDLPSSKALFEEAAPRASLLPAVKLMLALLQVRDSPGASNNKCAGLQWRQAQNVLSSAINIAQAIAFWPCSHPGVCAQPHVQQLLTAPELRQLLLAVAAWLVSVLHQQQQGQAAVDATAVVRCLSNSSAAATYATGTSSRRSSSSSSKVPTRHARVLELLGVIALLPDPSCRNSPANSHRAKQFRDRMLQKFDFMISAVLRSAAFCMEISAEGSPLLNGEAPAATNQQDTYYLSYHVYNDSNSSSASPSIWQQLAPALMCMLAEVVQLGPTAEVANAALCLLMPTVRLDVTAWYQPAGAAAVGELALQAGPALLHAVQQQQQQQQQDKQMDFSHSQFAAWHWGLAVMNAVSASGLLMLGPAWCLMITAQPWLQRVALS
jgi:hypothetical protein